MSESLPQNPYLPPSQPPVYPGGYPMAYYPPPAPKLHAEMTWQDLAAFLIMVFTVGFLSPLALIFAVVSFKEARAQKLRQHAVGMIGLILAAIGSAFWALFILVMIISMAAHH